MNRILERAIIISSPDNYEYNRLKLSFLTTFSSIMLPQYSNTIHWAAKIKLEIRTCSCWLKILVWLTKSYMIYDLFNYPSLSGITLQIFGASLYISIKERKKTQFSTCVFLSSVSLLLTQNTSLLTLLVIECAEILPYARQFSATPAGCLTI